MSTRSVLPGLALLALSQAAAASQYVHLFSPSQVSAVPPLGPGGSQTFTFKIDLAGVVATLKNTLVTAQLRVYLDTRKHPLPPGEILLFGPILVTKNFSSSATSASVTFEELQQGAKKLLGNASVPHDIKWEVCAGPQPDPEGPQPGRQEPRERLDQAHDPRGRAAALTGGATSSGAP